MRYKLKSLLSLLGLYLILKVFLSLLGLSKYYFDMFIPILPFLSIVNSFTILVLLFFAISFFASIIYYDEMFTIFLSYGISLLLIIKFSKKYSFINAFNYFLSIFIISILVFTIQVLFYFAKDRIVILSGFYKFISINLIIGFIYYWFYQLVYSRIISDNVKR